MRISDWSSDVCSSDLFTLSCTLISGFALPFVWISPDILDLAGLIAVGLPGGVGQILMTTAFKHGDVAVVAPLEYTAMIWATLFGYVFSGGLPGLNTLLGVSLVLAAGRVTLCVWEEGVVRKEGGSTNNAR